ARPIPANGTNANSSNPVRKSPLALLRRPIAYGPANPLRLANELIRAIPPAAAAPVRNFDGNGQKGPCALRRPADAIDRNITASVGDLTSAHARNAAAATAEAAAMCRQRSPVRSECAPTITIATAATRFGMAETKPI